MDANVDLIEDDHVDRFLAWLPTMDGVAFCVRHIEKYCVFLARGLGAQCSASNLSDDLREGVKSFLLLAECSREPFTRDFVHVPPTVGHQVQQEQRARDLLAEAVAARDVAKEADAKSVALNLDASEEPIPNQVVDDFLAGLTSRQEGLTFLATYPAETAEVVQRGLDLSPGVDVSVGDLDDDEGLRRSVERFLVFAEAKGCFERGGPETEDEALADGSNVSAEQRARDLLAEAAAARDVAKEADAKSVALNIDASEEPIPNQVVDDFLAALTRQQGLTFRAKYPAETSEVVQRGLDLSPGVDVSVGDLDDYEGLRRSVERFLVFAEAKGFFERRLETEDEASSDGFETTYWERVDAFPQLHDDAREARAQRAAAVTACDQKEKEVLSAVALARIAAVDEGARPPPPEDGDGGNAKLPAVGGTDTATDNNHHESVQRNVFPTTVAGDTAVAQGSRRIEENAAAKQSNKRQKKK